MEELKLANCYAFTDGSFNAETEVWGFGGFLVKNGEEVAELQGHGKEFAKSRNVAGEVNGAIAAIKKAIELGIEDLTIYYDYMGIEQWAVKAIESIKPSDDSMTGWKANEDISLAYVEALKTAEGKINLRFEHVKAHTGIPGNERADRLAKEACGVE